MELSGFWGGYSGVAKFGLTLTIASLPKECCLYGHTTISCLSFCLPSFCPFAFHSTIWIRNTPRLVWPSGIGLDPGTDLTAASICSQFVCPLIGVWFVVVFFFLPPNMVSRCNLDVLQRWGFRVPVMLVRRTQENQCFLWRDVHYCSITSLLHLLQIILTLLLFS